MNLLETGQKAVLLKVIKAEHTFFSNHINHTFFVEIAFFFFSNEKHQAQEFNGKRGVIKCAL